ncbi:SRPBCC domain-containing protein [bacterium]|nr:SRPBCC domain-containing protein [bacterium]
MRRSALAALLALFVGTPCLAEVTDVSPAGFTSRTVHAIAAGPERVWGAFGEIDKWWNGDHSWSSDAANLYLDPVAGEEFGERLPGGGSVTHMEVIYAEPGKRLRLRGSLGPLQEMAVTGVLSVTLKPTDEGTELTAVYAVGGYAPGGLEAIAPAVDRVVNEQFTRLGEYLAP